MVVTRDYMCYECDNVGSARDIVNGQTCDFKTFDGIDFSGKRFDDVVFRGCEFTNCKFDGSKFSNCSFEVAIAYDLKGHNASYVSSGFDTCVLDSVSFSDCDFGHFKIRDCSLLNSKFSKCVASTDSGYVHCEFFVDARGSIFKDSVFSDVSFSGDFSECQFEHTDLGRATFYSVSGKNTVFRNCNLSGAFFNKTFSGVKIKDSITNNLDQRTKLTHGDEFLKKRLARLKKGLSKCFRCGRSMNASNKKR